MAIYYRDITGNTHKNRCEPTWRTAGIRITGDGFGLE